MPNLNQVQWSETSARQLERFCATCTIISAFVYNGSQIVVVVERECSKPAENQQTLITNRLQETLVLAQNIQNNEKIMIFSKASLLTLTKDLFCKNVLFMGQNDLDPRTIDLNLNVNLAIEISYHYEYVAQVERLNCGTITACLRKGSAFGCKIR